MTKRDRVLNAINHKETDIIPYNIELTQMAYEKMSAYLGDFDFIRKIGNHISSVFYDGYSEEITPGSGFWRDRFGVVWNRTVDRDIGVVADCVLKSPKMNGYNFPAIDLRALDREMQLITGPDNDTFRVADVGFTLFERAWALRGMDNILMDMVLEHDFVNCLLDAITEYELMLIESIRAYDVDGFWFGDDWGQQKGLIMGPLYWREYIKPRMTILFSKVRESGKKVLLHSCGDIHEILPDLIEIGLDVYQTLQPEIYDIRKIKCEYGKDLTFWGGISTQTLLPYASVDEVTKVIRETMSIMGRNGGYIAAPSHAVPGDVPPENITAMIETFQNQIK